MGTIMPVILLAKTFGALVPESHYHSPNERVQPDDQRLERQDMGKLKVILVMLVLGCTGCTSNSGIHLPSLKRALANFSASDILYDRVDCDRQEQLETDDESSRSGQRHPGDQGC